MKRNFTSNSKSFTIANKHGLETNVILFTEEDKQQIQEIELLKASLKKIKEKNYKDYYNSDIKPNKVRIQNMIETINPIQRVEIETLRIENEKLKEALEFEKTRNLTIQQECDIEIDSYKKQITLIKLKQLEIENETIKTMRFEIVDLKLLIEESNKKKIEFELEFNKLKEEYNKMENIYKRKLKLLNDEIRANNEKELQLYKIKKKIKGVEELSSDALIDSIFGILNNHKFINIQAMKFNEKIVYLKSLIKKLIKERNKLHKRNEELHTQEKELRKKLHELTSFYAKVNTENLKIGRASCRERVYVLV